MIGDGRDSALGEKMIEISLLDHVRLLVDVGNIPAGSEGIVTNKTFISDGLYYFDIQFGTDSNAELVRAKSNQVEPVSPGLDDIMMHL